MGFQWKALYLRNNVPVNEQNKNEAKRFELLEEKEKVIWEQQNNQSFVVSHLIFYISYIFIYLNPVNALK